MAIQITTQVRPELLAEVHHLAVAKGEDLQSVLDEALTEWVARRGEDTPEVVAHRDSHERRPRPHEELANWANLFRL